MKLQPSKIWQCVHWSLALLVYLVTLGIAGNMIRVRDKELAKDRSEIGIYQDFVETHKENLKSTIKSVGNLVNAIQDEAEKREPVASAEEERILNEYLAKVDAITAKSKQRARAENFVFTEALTEFFAQSDADIELIRTDLAKPAETRRRIIRAMTGEQLHELYRAKDAAKKEN